MKKLGGAGGLARLCNVSDDLERVQVHQSCQLGGFYLICVSASHSLLEYLSTFSKNSHSVFAVSASPSRKASVSWRGLF